MDRFSTDGGDTRLTLAQWWVLGYDTHSLIADSNQLFFVPSLEMRGAPANRAIRLAWTVNTTLPVTSTWRITYYSQTVASTVSFSNIVSPTRAFTLTGLTNYAWHTVTLNAMLSNSPFLTDTVRLMPTDQFVYLPVVIR
jgi:hypothetical protein